MTDSAILSILPLVARHFVKAQVRHFDYADKDRALNWLTAAGLKVEVFADPEAVAAQAAAYIAGEARLAVAARGGFVLAVSGGQHAADHAAPPGRPGRAWKEGVGGESVDERVAPAEDRTAIFSTLKKPSWPTCPWRRTRCTPCRWRQAI